MERKGWPLLIQSDTNPSLTMAWTRAYMLMCVGEKCAAYQGGFCVKYQTDVVLKEGVKDGSTTD